MSKKRRPILMGRLIVILAITLFLPGMLNAGDLNPPGAPAPTMKTLDQIPPTWSRKITDDRFDIVLSGGGVLDKESGLVWERYPSTTTFSAVGALNHCIKLNKGGRKGWHLPTVQQLATLVDPDMSSPSLPSGHPFLTNYVQSAPYWTSSTHDYDPIRYWYIDFADGDMSWQFRDTEYYAWCVRGGQSYDYAR